MMKNTVFLTRKLHDFALNDLKKRYRVKVHSGRIPIPQKELLSGIRDAHGLICFPYDLIDNKVLDAAKNLRVISTYSVGFDHIDIECARQKKIRVGHTPDVLTDATADLAFGLMINLQRRISEGDRIIRRGGWTAVYGPQDHLGTDLRGSTLGILGLGRIGKALARRAGAFGMNLLYHGRHRAPESVEKQLGIKYVSFSGLIKKSDAISIHVPYTAKTRHLFDAAVFEGMKRTAFVINTSRGMVVNERDLAAALGKKTIAGAGLDVFEFEPISGRHPLAKLDNVVLAPHIGSAAAGTREEMARITVKNLDLGMDGKRPLFSVGC